MQCPEHGLVEVKECFHCQRFRERKELEKRVSLKKTGQERLKFGLCFVCGSKRGVLICKTPSGKDMCQKCLFSFAAADIRAENRGGIVGDMREMGVGVVGMKKLKGL